MFETVNQADFGATLSGFRELNGLSPEVVAHGLRLKSPKTLTAIESGQKPITRSQFEHIVERICIQSCQPDLVE